MPLIELEPPPARHRDAPPARAFGARLEQQHAMPAALRQPARDHRARGPRADEDVVVGWIGLHWCSPVSLEGEGSSLGGG